MGRRAKLIEVRNILDNMAATFKDAQRVNFFDDGGVLFPEYQVDGIIDGLRDMSKIIGSVLEGL